MRLETTYETKPHQDAWIDLSRLARAYGRQGVTMSATNGTGRPVDMQRASDLALLAAGGRSITVQASGDKVESLVEALECAGEVLKRPAPQSEMYGTRMREVL